MSDVKVLKSNKLELEHGFFAKNGGVSDGYYSSLNFSKKEASVENVRKNLDIVAQTMGINANIIKMISQKHTPDVLVLKDINQDTSLIEADAIVSNVPGSFVAIITADCCPVLLCDPSNGVIAAVHSGWRGAVSGIAHNSVSHMVALGADSRNIVGVIGPSISQKSYEVGLDVFDKFVNLNPESADFFMHTSVEGKFLFDLKGFVLRSFLHSGVEMMEDIGVDTYSDKSFFSCRRAAHNTENGFGCQISLIGLK